jgi:hypothetical protein
MSEVLKKYVLPNSQEATQKEYNINLSKGLDTAIPLDYNRAFTFLEWAAQNQTIRDDLKKEAYQKYLERWHSNRFDKQTSNDIVKNQYKQLIERLQFIFKDDENFKRLTNINLDDPYDIEVLIPLVSKKLRDIALYYTQQRASAKKTKIKYNIAGSEGAIEKLFAEHILRNFTDAKYQTTIIEQSAFASLPALSSIKNDFKIVIQELYDTSNYFDKNSNNKLIYENLKSNFISEFCDNTSGQDFYSDLGVYDALIDNPLFFDLANYISDVANMAASATIDLNGIDSNKLSEFKATAKYLGTDLYYVSGGYYVPKTDQLNIDIQSGTNLFYWPSGEFAYNGINELASYKELPINESKFLTLGTAATAFENADKIFINRCGYGIQGAWLQKGSSIAVEDVFKIEIQGALKCEGRTALRYPFAGRGYFVDDVWTGIQTNGLINKTYFTEEELFRLEGLYWNTTINDITSAADPIAINDTFLISDGAKPGKLYSEADHLWIRQTTNVNRIEDESPNGVFNNAVNDYWLYKFQKTELPIAASTDLGEAPTAEAGNHIFWPYVGSDAESYSPLPSYAVHRYKTCLPVSLADLNVHKEFGAANAGGTALDSDVIIKLDECGVVKDASILIGSELKNFNSTSWGEFVFANQRLNNFNYSLSSGYIQPGLAFKATPNLVAPFVWQANGAKFGDLSDVPDTDINDLNAFRGVKHEPNCSYYNTDTKSIFYYRDQIANATKCTCKAINHSPLGHKGNRIDNFDSLTDLVFEITDPKDLNKFDIDEWKDSLGRSWRTSDRIAYFRIDADNKDKDVGWGTGQWITPNGGKFYLRPGVAYGYYRNGRLTCASGNENLFLVINHLYCNIKEYPAQKDELCYAYDFMYDFRPRWVDLVVDPDTEISTWKVKSYDATSMVLYPGDHLVYIHRNKNEFKLKWTNSLDTEQNNTNSNTLSYNTTNFVWQSKLYGWDYGTNKWSGSPTAYGARPYWALADEFCAANEFNLSIGSARSNVLDYLFINQPKFATDSIKHFDTIEYFRRDENAFIWTQNFTVYDNSATNVWRSIDLVEKEPNIKHNCSVDTRTEYQCFGFPTNIVTDNPSLGTSREVEAFDKILIVQSLSAESDILFESSSLDQPVSILYCAKNPFTFTQELTDLSVGLPPAGGLYVPLTSGLLVKAEKPYANILNLNNPTVAFIESSANLHLEEDLGIYTPSNLNLTIYNGSDIEKEANVDNDYRDNVFAVINPNSYINNRGMSDVDSDEILKIKLTDASKIKYPPTAGCKSSSPRHDKGFSNFNAYQASYEVNGNDSLSIPFDEKFDPWIGVEEAEWFDTVNFKKNLYGEYNTLSGNQSWVQTRFNETASTITKAQTDVFGNHYILFKDVFDSTIYEAKDYFGRMYVKDLNNKTLPAVSALKNVYELYKASYPSIYNQLIVNHIKDIDVYYDTIITHLSNNILIDRINENFESGEIFSTSEVKNIGQSESTFVIDMQGAIGNASTLLHPEDNLVTLMYMASSDCYITPIFYEHLLGDDSIKLAYNGETDATILINSISAYQFNEYVSPTLAYDAQSGLYTITVLAKNTTHYGEAFFTLFYNLKKEDKIKLQSVNVLKPFVNIPIIDFDNYLQYNNNSPLILNSGCYLELEGN